MQTHPEKPAVATVISDKVDFKMILTIYKSIS